MAGPRQTTLPLGDAPAPSTPRSDPPPPPPPDVAPLSAALEAALLRELARVHESDSWAHFGSRLRAPVFELVDSATRLGRWVHATRTIELARALVLERPWPDVVAVLQHEMAHQYVDEVLGVRDESAHGDTFRRVCAERGIDARAAGAPGPPAGASPEVDRVLGRVRKLLALAGSANQHEAEAAMQRAHELMLRHNVEVAAAVAAPEFEVRHVGAPRRRRDPVESAIIVLLIDCFFVKAIRVPVYLVREGTRATQYELSGTRANLDLALHVHDFLLQTAARLWTANRHDARIRSGHDRLAYQTGVIRGFHDKLRAERKTLAGTGLIWRGDARLDAFYHRRHPRLRSSRSTTRARVAHLAGREAGQRVVLHRPVEGARGGTTRLLRGGD